MSERPDTAGHLSAPLPAKRPCGSCPYRCDVPAGLWHPEEYAKLPTYDRPTGEQPPNLFACHQQDGRLCAGWVATIDVDESLAIRMAVLTGNLDIDQVDALHDYSTDVALFESGLAAAKHGMSGVEEPDAKAQRAIETLRRKQQAR